MDEEMDRRLSLLAIEGAHTSFRTVNLRAVEYKPTWRSQKHEPTRNSFNSSMH